MSTAIKMRLFGAALGALSCAAPVSAQIALDDPRLKTDRILYDYVEPKNAAHFPLYEVMKKTQVLEKLQEFLAPLRLPIPIMIKTESCGIANSYFDVDTIKVCYEYLEYIKKMTPRTVRQGLTPNDQLIGPIADVFLHEFGHAVVRVLDIPFFAKEEDVADYIATYILLMFSDDDARRLLLGTTFLAGAEAKDEQAKTGELSVLADSHSLPAQRFFNKWCMAYGSDKELFADAVELGMLPAHRLKWCRWEWVTNEDAFKRLIMPYVDIELLKKNKDKKWFKFEAPVSATMSPKGAKEAEALAPAKAAKQ
jgi:Putative metallopeptidase